MALCRYRPQPQAAPRQEGPTARSTAEVVSDICAMGFERRHVEHVLQNMVREGKAIDLNAVVDVLMAETR